MSSAIVTESNVGPLLSEYEAGIRDAIAAGTLVKSLKDRYPTMQALMEFRCSNETHDAIKPPRFMWTLLVQVLQKATAKEPLNNEWAATQKAALARWDAAAKKMAVGEEKRRRVADAAGSKTGRQKQTMQDVLLLPRTKMSSEQAAGDLQKKPKTTVPRKDVEAVPLLPAHDKGKNRALEQSQEGSGALAKAPLTQAPSAKSNPAKVKHKPSNPQPVSHRVEPSIRGTNPRTERAAAAQPPKVSAPATGAKLAKREQRPRIPTEEMSRMSVDDTSTRKPRLKSKQQLEGDDMDVDDERAAMSESGGGLKQSAAAKPAAMKRKREKDDDDYVENDSSGDSATSDEEEASDEDIPKVKPPPSKRGKMTKMPNADDEAEVTDEDGPKFKPPPTRRGQTVREPKPTGYQFDPPCDRCFKNNRDCMESLGIRTCCECVRQKVKCDWERKDVNKTQPRKGPAPKRRKKTQSGDDAPTAASNSKAKAKGKGKAPPATTESAPAPAPKPARAQTGKLAATQVAEVAPRSKPGVQNVEDEEDEVDLVALRSNVQIMYNEMQSMADKHSLAMKVYEDRLHEMSQRYGTTIRALQNDLAEVKRSSNAYRQRQREKIQHFIDETRRDMDFFNEIQGKIIQHIPGGIESSPEADTFPDGGLPHIDDEEDASRKGMPGLSVDEMVGAGADVVANAVKDGNGAEGSSHAAQAQAAVDVVPRPTTILDAPQSSGQHVPFQTAPAPPADDKRPSDQAPGSIKPATTRASPVENTGNVHCGAAGEQDARDVSCPLTQIASVGPPALNFTLATSRPSQEEVQAREPSHEPVAIQPTSTSRLLPPINLLNVPRPRSRNRGHTDKLMPILRSPQPGPTHGDDNGIPDVDMN